MPRMTQKRMPRMLVIGDSASKFVGQPPIVTVPRRPANFTQSQAISIFKAAAKAGLNVRVEFHSDGTIIASTSDPMTPNIQEPRPETPGDLKKLI
jgi:hypothetical protein